MKKYILLAFAFVCFTTLNAQEIKFGDVSKAELEEKQHPKDPEAAAAGDAERRRMAAQKGRTQSVTSNRSTILG